ncbi:EPIDERMAL PATTERNING FACTOR-like protein 6 [Actinidia eriantha]|uniref:EPIDERMAL PATTERNING FACTOR-like protein 6 n=1 Tax=Actinidia eriantha TaxID=165200 RepID=UPI00258CB141|nr:EPIDERMAL PATTERNING FACTOR-like protein 6 [Actinidia eriantha]
MEWNSTHRLRFVNKKTPLFYGVSLFVISALALLGTICAETDPCLDIRCQMATKADISIQEFEMVLKKMNDKQEIKISKAKMEEVSLSLSRTRRFLSGPGSWPPRCTSKCGRCTPCNPVHMLVPPGTPVMAEYYPEAWRCKCGNRLYIP